MSSNAQTTAPRTVAYSPDAFERLVHDLSRTVREEGRARRILFAGASDEQAQQALATFTTESSFNIHQFDLRNLIADRPAATRGNVRETFDAAGEEAAVLFLNHGDAFFDQPADAEADDDALTPVDYLLDRIESFRGIVVLCLRSAEHRARAREAAVFDVIVEF